MPRKKHIHGNGFQIIIQYAMLLSVWIKKKKNTELTIETVWWISSPN